MSTTPTAKRTQDLARTIEQAECAQLRQQMDALARLIPSADPIVLDLQCGGVAVLAPTIASPRFNYATGLEGDSEPTEESIRSIEALYFAHNRPAIIRLQPGTSRWVFAALQARGFTLAAFVDVYVRSLSDISLGEMPPSSAAAAAGVVGDSANQIIRVTPAITPEDRERFIVACADGFEGGDGSSRERYETMARITASARKTQLYLVWIDDCVAGSGAVHYLDLPATGERVAYVELGSIRPQFRSQGVAAAAARAQLVDAKREGAQWVYAIVKQGNKSADLCRKLGFRLLHNKPILKKQPPPRVDQENGKAELRGEKLALIADL
ncbi:uncharacterized protein BP01DRAFT_363216 [Aspergillus saccharolyticus JOP 1030-1]|uniref:N-acetyltransferase domain-containing protein n=1 Tax=Aspergillus saccharolyticus JOP 1030-1 TaxID=1450539 RepID=A0A318ZUL4_9EURO|nr:hypothetical protein BP01DRAFT_363216 [Aspergillus saccharolyticus JOP 1030-1]PYH48033.1 hypothetical protein BP01DRAFT_363216 [Aspergillus saccharolyticus JOP 1030-1]